MLSVGSLLRNLEEQNAFGRVANNRLLQFGSTRRRYLMSELLPEQTVRNNMFRDEGIRFRTEVANSGGRYSPVQIKGTALVGSMAVELGESDIGSEFTGEAYDMLLNILNNDLSMEAETQVIRWLDTTVARGLAELREKQRCDAIVKAKVIRVGDGDYKEEVEYPNPTGHRITVPSGTVASPQGWYNGAYDPFQDILGLFNMLANEKGLNVTRIISSRKLLTLLNNHIIVQRYGSSLSLTQGQLNPIAPGAFPAIVNNAFAINGLPTPEFYDLRLTTSTGTERFIPEDVLIMVCSTGRNVTLDLGDKSPLPLFDTLGYTAIGRAVGQQNPGVVIRTEAKDDKPPRIQAEGWQTMLPVIQDPEAIAVIRVPAPTP